MMRRWIVGIAAMAAGVMVCAGAADGQYVQRWANNHNLANLDDIGEDVVIGVEGHVFSVGWVTVSSTKTQYRLRVLDGDVAGDPTGGSVIATKVWPTAPNTDGFHKAHAVAIGQTAQPQEEGGVALIPIYVTGESPNVAGEGLNIVTLRYMLAYTPNIAGGTVTGPDICTYNNALLVGGNGKDDVAYSIAYAPEREKDDPPQPAALFVGGASQGRIAPGGAESGYDYKVINYNPVSGLIPQAWQGFEAGRFNRILGANSPDEAYAIALDWLGEVYITGRTKLTSFDFGTVRFFRSDGELDDGVGPGAFPAFFSAGTAGQDDQANAVAAHYGYIVDEPNPDVAVVGTVVTTGQLKNIRTIKYEDHD